MHVSVAESSYNAYSSPIYRGRSKPKSIHAVTLSGIYILNKNTLGVKKVRGQSEAALQIGMYDQKL